MAEVYDELFQKNSDETGKLTLTDEKFKQEFKDNLNKKLPEIVQETVDSQFFGIG